MQANAVYRMGLDIGSTTVKLVMLDGDDVIYSEYRRHNTDIQGELQDILEDLQRTFPDVSLRLALTGSGGLGVAEWLDVPFVQEVIAETRAIEERYPETDVIIELGGEDAKITYLKPVPEQRMNGTCAGGTGAFIDQMAALLQTDAAGLNELASRFQHLHPIASRCGVFAKTDLQPLLNDDAAKEDLAASVFQAVVNQTIAGLACGRPIRGNVIFLGGPLHFLPELRRAFERTLKEQVSNFYTPDNAQLFVALGAALMASGDPIPISELVGRFHEGRPLMTDITRIRPLFLNADEKWAFDERHDRAMIELCDIDKAEGPCYLGIDAGSTTTKAVLINKKGDLIYTYYDGNKGNPVASAVQILKSLYRELPAKAHIAYSVVTGYGEKLIQAALGMGEGEVETMAHYKSAEFFCPDVDYIIDIGGQDMKCVRIRNGVIDNIQVNEACSSGCGSFIQSFAQSMELDAHTFSLEALKAESPVDLGTRCTVFMNSRVKQAQKEGATVGDISAGLSYSVVRNALYKVIKVKDPKDLGKHIVCQGGTFLNDAVLRCFELISGREVIRPNIAGLMGAFGAALIARERWTPETKSNLLTADELNVFAQDMEIKRCELCANHCQLTVSTFSNGARFVSGNRCERGAGEEVASEKLPNLFNYKYKRLFRYRSLPAKEAPRGTIGIPRVLNMFENYPFWHTLLTQLGFSVVLSTKSSHDLFEKGMESIPSESVCYPAKLAHGHIMDLLERGVTTIFYPDIVYEQHEFKDADNYFNCPIVVSYPEVIKNNVEDLRSGDITYLNPFFNLAKPKKLVERIVETFADWGVSKREAQRAVDAAYAEDETFRSDMRKKGRETLAEIAERGIDGIVLAGRPYHCDPGIHHGIPEMINSLGLAVLTEDSILGDSTLERPLRVVDQWAYHSRLYEAAAIVCEHDNLELVQLNSFGCGLDAITTDQVQEILEASGKISTTLKIDEISNLGAARIRLRSLRVAMNERKRNAVPRARRGTYAVDPVDFTPAMREQHTILAPQMSPIHFSLIEAALRSQGYKVKVLRNATPEDVETGLKFVNNDACYPSIMVVGQLIRAFTSGAYDPDNTSVAITQTGGGCRATNYVAFLRKALKDAGFAQVPVIALSATGIETNTGFKFTIPLLHRALQAIVLGDLLQNLLLRTRPYEVKPGAANELYHTWDDLMRSYFLDRELVRKRFAGKVPRYRQLIEECTADFAALPQVDGPRKPRVGIVGEILVKFHPDANNNAIGVVEEEGFEAAMPGLLDFFLYCFYGQT